MRTTLTTPTCACGCGRSVRAGNRYVHGHSGFKFADASGSHRPAGAKIRERAAASRRAAKRRTLLPDPQAGAVAAMLDDLEQRHELDRLKRIAFG